MDAAALRAQVDAIERRMLDQPELIADLQAERVLLQAALVRAALSEHPEPEEQQPLDWVERERLWREFCEARVHMRRSTMSAATKARLIAKFGRGPYGAIPW